MQHLVHVHMHYVHMMRCIYCIMEMCTSVMMMCAYCIMEMCTSAMMRY